MEEAILEELKKISGKLDTLAAILTQKSGRSQFDEHRNGSIREQIEKVRAEAMVRFGEMPTKKEQGRN